MAGIAGGDGKTTGVQIMGCHILREDGQSASTEDDIANAFVYAADHHAVIANNSWRHEESEILRTAIDYFMDKAGQFEEAQCEVDWLSFPQTMRI